MFFDRFSSSVGAKGSVQMIGDSLVVDLDRASGDDMEEHLLVMSVCDVIC